MSANMHANLQIFIMLCTCNYVYTGIALKSEIINNINQAFKNYIQLFSWLIMNTCMYAMPWQQLHNHMKQIVANFHFSYIGRLPVAVLIAKIRSLASCNLCMSVGQCKCTYTYTCVCVHVYSCINVYNY